MQHSIENGIVFGEFGFEKRNICFCGGKITPCGSIATEKIDAEGCYIIPGLIDIHIHGCVGHEFASCTHTELEKMLKYQANQGITALCPTMLTLPENKLARACALMTKPTDRLGAEISGIYMEGPFLSPAKLGAQNPNYICLPDIEMFYRLQAHAKGLIKLLAIAPEMPGTEKLIREIGSEVICCLAHTDANYDVAMRAFEDGARQVTHLFNAMPPFTHREPGIVGAAVETNCFVELISDLQHVHPSVVRASFKLFGEDRIIMISDSMMATGLGDGVYSLGGLTVNVCNKKATLSEGGNLAGSVTNLTECLRLAVEKANIPLYSAVKSATMNPAKAIDIYDERGSLDTGKIADILILNPDLSLRCVILRGQQLWNSK